MSDSDQDEGINLGPLHSFNYYEDEWSQDENNTSENSLVDMEIEEDEEPNEEDEELDDPDEEDEELDEPDEEDEELGEPDEEDEELGGPDEEDEESDEPNEEEGDKLDEDLESVISRHSLVVRDVYSLSFRKFSVHWKRDRKKYICPLDSNKQTFMFRKRYRLGPIIQAGHGQTFADNVKLVIEEFVEDTVVPKLLAEEDDEEFLNLFEALWWYIGAVRTWLRFSFLDLHTTKVPGQTNINFLQYCRLVMIMPVYSATKNRLQRACLNTLQKVRSMYPYCHKHVMMALYERVFERIQQFIMKCVGEDENELKTLWWDPFKQQFFEQFSVARDFENSRLTELDYLTFVDGIMTAECTLFERLPQPKDSDWYNKFEIDLRDKLCEEYQERKENNCFHKTLDYLNHEDMTFNKRMFKRLAKLHLTSASHGERFLDSLKSEVKKKKIEILNRNRLGIEEQSECPLEGFRPSLVILHQYNEVISSRLKDLMEGHLHTLKVVADECGENLHADLEMTANPMFRKVPEAQNKLLRQLCNGTTTRDEYMKERKSMELFFKFIADQRGLLGQLEAFVREEIENHRVETVRVISAFVKLEVVQPSVSECFSGLFQTYNVVPIDERT